MMEAWDVKTTVFLGGDFHICCPEKYDFDTCKGISWKKKNPYLPKKI